MIFFVFSVWKCTLWGESSQASIYKLKLLLLARSCCRLLSCVECHGFLLLLRCRRRLLRREHPHSCARLGCQRNDGCAGSGPHLNADAAQWRTGKAQDPFHIVWHPVSWQPEHGRFGEPELQDEAEALGAEPAHGFDGRIERSLVGAKRAICVFIVSFVW